MSREKLTKRQLQGLQRLHDAGDLPTDGSEVTIDTGERVLVPFTALWHESAALVAYLRRMTGDDFETIVDRNRSIQVHRHRAAVTQLLRTPWTRYDKADRILSACGVSLALFELAHGDPVFARLPERCPAPTPVVTVAPAAPVAPSGRSARRHVFMPDRDGGGRRKNALTLSNDGGRS